MRLLPKGRQSFRPIPSAAYAVCSLPRLRGRVGEGVARTHEPCRVPHPSPPPHAGEGTHRARGNITAAEEPSRHADEIDHRRLVRMRREADGGGAGGGKRLRDLAGETKVHERERALVHAGARGAIEIDLRAAAGKMQDAVERTLRKRHRNRGRETFDLDRAINHRGHHRHAARGKVTGAVLAGEIEERRGTLVEARAQERGEIVLVAVDAFDLVKARGGPPSGGGGPT